MTTIYNRFDPAKHYEAHRFVPGRPLQSAELNEVQALAAFNLKGVGDTILKDGNVVRDAGVIINPDTGVTICEAGAVYLAGVVRSVAAGSVTIPIVGTIAIGLRLQTSIITSIQDPDLLDPAPGVRSYHMEGADRTKVIAVWAWSGDSQSGDFYPVYTATNGVLNAKEPPPQLDGVTQAIARYDRDSAGGSYVVSGLQVQRLADRNDGYQVFSVASGRARVNGLGLDLSTSVRLPYNAQPVLKFIDSEPVLSTNATSMRVNVARPPLARVARR